MELCETNYSKNKRTETKKKIFVKTYSHGGVVSLLHIPCRLEICVPGLEHEMSR